MLPFAKLLWPLIIHVVKHSSLRLLVKFNTNLVATTKVIVKVIGFSGQSV